MGDDSIPTGEYSPVDGGPMDFRTPKLIGRDLPALLPRLGYDHTWVLDAPGNRDVPAAELYDPSTGRGLSVYTDQPGIQVYTGNVLDGTPGAKGGATYRRHAGICLETQCFPDAVNRPAWPSIVVGPDQTYATTTEFAFWVK